MQLTASTIAAALIPLLFISMAGKYKTSSSLVGIYSDIGNTNQQMNHTYPFDISSIVVAKHPLYASPIAILFVELWMSFILTFFLLVLLLELKVENTRSITGHSSHDIMQTYEYICGPSNILSFAIANGMLVAIDIWVGSAISGGTFNPARVFGPALVNHYWDAQWAYWVGGIIGCICACTIYKFIYIPMRKVMNSH